MLPNARHEPRLEAGAERTLEGVGSMPRLCENSLSSSTIADMMSPSI